MSLAAVDRAGLRPRVEKALAAFLAGQHARLTELDPALSVVSTALESFILGGGKRLRPAFGYWGFRGSGAVDSDELINALAALELVQASALIHDDVMDDSEIRRGEPAIHRRFAARAVRHGWAGDPDAFGRSAAILLGDLCLIWSDELLHGCGLPPEPLTRARPVFDQMRTEVSAGQYLDVLAQVTEDTSVERAETIAVYKSAKYTVERPLLFGAALADAPESVRAAYRGYGLPLGEAFQLRDDILGVYGDPTRTGKPAGDDLRAGKRTYLVAIALSNGDPIQRQALRDGLGDRSLDQTGITRLREVIESCGALARTEHRITELTDQALAALNPATLTAEAIEALTDLAGAATRRVG